MRIDLGHLLLQALINSIKTTPTLWLMILAIFLLSFAIYIFKLIRLAKSGMLDIDKFSGGQFENYLEILFRNDGYKVTAVGSAKGDYGADLILEKDGKRTAVQAKCWHYTVGEKAVQEVVSSKAIYNCQEAMVVTNRWFSFQAQHLAKVNGVILWNRNDLVNAILRIRKQNYSKKAF
jgi:restriction system protein